MTEMPVASEDLLTHTSEIVVAHLAHNPVPMAELPTLITGIYQSLAALSAPPAPQAPPEPAVPIRASIRPDHLVCLEDGRKLKMLKRYLRTHYDMTPEEYRTKWGLPGNYPMVAPSYAEQRSTLARKAGLGRKPAQATPNPISRADLPATTPLPQDKTASDDNPAE